MYASSEGSSQSDSDPTFRETVVGRPRSRRVSATAIALLVLVIAACDGEDDDGGSGGPPTVPRDLTDTTAPTIHLSITASPNTDSGLEELAPGSNVTLEAPGGSVIVMAEDTGGVGWVEFWMTETRTCGGTTTGPGLAGAPTERVEGDLSSTAPQSLSAGIDINTMNLRSDCVYRWEVWGEAANAATTPVQSDIAFSTLTYQPPA